MPRDLHAVHPSRVAVFMTCILLHTLRSSFLASFTRCALSCLLPLKSLVLGEERGLRVQELRVLLGVDDVVVVQGHFLLTPRTQHFTTD